MRRALRLVRSAAPVAALLLSACGGGGGGVNFVPAPPVTPPPPATPTSFPVTQSASFDTITAQRTTQTNGAPNLISVASQGTTSLGSATTFSYDQKNGTYTITGPTDSATFTGASASVDGNFDKFDAQSGNITDELTLFKNAATTDYSGIQLTYVSFGKWSHIDSGSGKTELTYFVFGFPTSASEMPASGTASYNTSVSGNEYLYSNQGQTGPADLNGSATFDVDFGTAKIDTTLTLSRADNSLGVGTFTGTGLVSASQFSGTFASTDPNFTSGTFTGGFFGPDAKDMGYTFDIREHNPDPYSGAALPYLLDAWIMGSVVGTKK